MPRSFKLGGRVADANRAVLRRNRHAVLGAARPQVMMRKADGWQTLATTPVAQPIDLAAWDDSLRSPNVAE